jgi:hypothetical protein
MGPTVVVPPQHLMAPSKASEVASGIETARYRLETVGTPGSPDYTPAETCVTDKYAFAFGELLVAERTYRPDTNFTLTLTVCSFEADDRSQKQLRP